MQLFYLAADRIAGVLLPYCAIDWFCIVFLQDAISAAQQRLDDLAAAAQAADPQAFGEDTWQGRFQCIQQL